MLKRLLLIALLLLPVLSNAEPQLEVTQAWVRIPPGKSKVTAAYMYIKNSSQQEISIVKASSPVADKTELHTHIMHPNGQIEMTKQPEVVIPAQTEITFKPGHMHIMLINVNTPLEIGREIPITLHLKDGTTQTFRAEIQPLTYAPQQRKENK